MDDPNITMEEYIRLEEEKARRHGKVYNWETATYGRIRDDDEVHNLRSVETEFPTIVFDDTFTSQAALSCEPTVSPLNDKKIDFRISFDESDDEDYTVIFDKNSFSYKLVSVDNLKTYSENDNDKVDMPSFPSSEPTVSYFNNLEYFKDFENEFPATVYNDALTSKLDFLTEPTVSPQHIDEFNSKDETSLFECDDEEQNNIHFNDLFPLNKIYLEDLKSVKDNDDDEIQSSGGNVINIDTKGLNKLLETSHDRIGKIFHVRSFIMELKLNTVGWSCLNNWMPLNLIKNLYVPIGIPFDPKQYYKDGVYTRILQRPRVIRSNDMTSLPPRDQRHEWLRYQVEGYTEDIMHNFEQRLEMIFGKSVNRVHVLYFAGLTEEMRQTLASRMSDTEIGLDVADTLCFQLGGARRRMTWRQFILVLGLHTAENMAEDGFEAYWLG
ncbi:hypothetical protein Tco_1442951, partial [Tanacetum coccineum]